MINKAYQQKKNLEQIKKTFSENDALPSVQLQDFLNPETVKQLIIELKKEQFTRQVKPMIYSYSIGSLPHVLQKLYSSSEFHELITDITGKKFKGIKGKFLKFEQKDHTLLHDSDLEKSGIDIIFDITKDWNEMGGGSIYYVGGDGDFHEIPPQFNTLIIAERRKYVHKFVKYCTHYATDRILFMGTLQ